MATWQRRARLIIAIVGIAFAVLVARAFRTRTPAPPPTVVERSDPEAVVETAGEQTLRFNRDKEEIRITSEKRLTNATGQTRLDGVTVTGERGGRDYEMTADSAQVTDKESLILLEGHVRVTANDGLVLTTDRATYAENEGMVRAPGAVQFSRGRTSGSSVGMTYDKNRDVLVLLDEAVVSMTPGDGAGAMQLTSGTAEFRRADNLITFDRALQVQRAGRTMTAPRGVARLAADGETLQTIELRGGAAVEDVPDGPGGVETLQARDMDLRYGADGTSLEHALLTGEAAIQIAGPAGQDSRRITANVIDVTLSHDATPTALIARDRVQLLVPGDAGGATRTIAAQALDASGEGGQGLRAARFTGEVQFRERGSGIDRAARSGVLDLAMAAGLGAIQEARFSRAVRFEESNMAADAAAARYVLDKGTLALSGREPGREKPHVTHERFGVYATTIDVTLQGPDVHASGDVKSVLQPTGAADARAGGGGARLPSMLKRDQVVNVSANELQYRAADATATYTGNALLWQGETSIKSDRIVLDDRQGDLSGEGAVVTSMILEQTTDRGAKERVRTTTTAKALHYEEAARKATYTGDAHMNSAQGDMTAARIELFLSPTGDQLDRAEAYDTVTLREKTRKTTGARLTYYGADERYVMSGAPVTVVDECARETIGRTLTFYRTTDRIVIDGSEQIRTQTKGGSRCSGN